MLPGWLALTSFLAIIAAFYALARWGEGLAVVETNPRVRKTVYGLSACVYGSAWSYFGSVGLAARGGWSFLPTYLGPMLAFALLVPLVRRLVQLSKTQNITSVADFIAARYGKSADVAALITAIVVTAYIPYIAVQLHVIARSLAIFVDGTLPIDDHLGPTARRVGLLTTGLIAAVTLAIGARRLETRHHRGLMVAVAAESIIKLTGFLVVGAFVTWGLFEGPADVATRIHHDARVAAAIEMPPAPVLWLAVIVATMATLFFMPRQFHVSIVENRDERDIKTAAWVVPLYLFAITLFVVPIAGAGLLTFTPGTIDMNYAILALPIQADAPGVALCGLIGALSAAASMVLVSVIILATMVANDLVLPLVLRLQARGRAAARDAGAVPILAIRRVAIVAILLGSLLLSIGASERSLSIMSLIALASFAQIAPPAIGGLFWRRGTARGAIGGPLVGIAISAYTFLVPALVFHERPSPIGTPLGLDIFGPADLFDLDHAPFEQALIWSLALNTLAYVLLSLSRPASVIERLQAAVFVRQWSPGPEAATFARRSGLSTRDLMIGVSRYLGPDIEGRFRDHQGGKGLPFDLSREADPALAAFAETLMASAIGATSSRLVIARLQRETISREAALRIADDLAFEIHDNRDILQHAIDAARDGMAVYDADLRLVAWNRAYCDMFQLPPHLRRVGVTLDMIIRANAERGLYGEGPVERFVSTRFAALTQPTEGVRLSARPFGRVLEMKSMSLHNGGIFFIYTDATERAKSEEELETENERLEKRVSERTEELQHLNFELARAKAEAEDANISKTRFLAAASHDLLQPLNAARLYMTSLRERLGGEARVEDSTELAANVDASLEAVEDILGALLEISHLDAGATPVEMSDFAIDVILNQLKMEFDPIATQCGLRLIVLPSSLWVRSDRRLLRRLLQNLISNALKYTIEGRVLVGMRRFGGQVRIDVCDTGLGIPKSKQQAIFREFTRLPAAVKAAPGLGLGLSIVDRLSRVLDHPIDLRSRSGRGSTFSVTLRRVPNASLIPTGALESPTPTRFRSLDGLVVATIDNEPHILAGMDALLRGWDCIVASGTGLTEIESALAATGVAPDVIVADFHVGDSDGIAIVTRLRKRHGFRPAVLITADRSPSVKARALAEDIRVLHKPLKPAALRSLLSQWRLVKDAPPDVGSL